jgi:hypothetical protein
MTDIVIEQAILSRIGGAGHILARSSGFREEWQQEAERLAVAFGGRPEAVPCPEAVFAQPLDKNQVAIVKVADREGETSFLGFHFLIVPRVAYRTLWGDPFLLAERAPSPWHSRGELPSLSWPAEPLPPRTVEDVRKVLQQTKAVALPEDMEVAPAANAGNEVSETALSPALLGGVQVLVDGGRLLFERAAPDPGLMRGLWTLLPHSTRSGLWPASFAFGTAIPFDALVAPSQAVERMAGARYTTEDQAADYPQGRYELSLQVAAEAGSQAELDALFGRRSSAETLRLGLALLVAVAVLAIGTSWFQPAGRPVRVKLPRAQGRALHITSMVGLGNSWQAISLYKARPDLWDEHATDRKEQP